MALQSPYQLPDEELIASFCAQFPCREQQIRSLVALLNPSIQSPRNIVLYGLEATGKSAITSSLLSVLQSTTSSTTSRDGLNDDTANQLRYAVVKSAECITGRHLLETTVKSVADAVSLRSSDSRCENLAQLVVAINRILEDQSDSSTPGFGKFVLVFDGIDRQRDAPPTLLPALARLGELVPNVTVIFIVTSPRPHFLHNPGAPHIHFPAYTKSEAVQILSLDPPPIYERDNTPLDGEEDGKLAKETKDFWSRYCGVVWDTLSKHSGHDILSFRSTCHRLWPAFTAPLREGLFAPKDFTRLLVSKRSLFQDDKVLVPSIISTTSTPTPQNVQAKYDSGIASQLPLFSRLLLISAYICSYTPSRHDESLFLKQSLKKRKRGGGTAKTPSKRQTKNRKISGKLLGPQSFVLERLLAVFQVVRLDAGVGGPGVVSSGADIYMAIATLASLRLVTKGSQGGDPLDGGTKWRVNVGWEVARSMARSVKVELEDFLLD